MPRYIDADKLVAWCKDTYQAQSTTEGKAYVNAFLTQVFSAPTADVVPKSEYDDLKFQFEAIDHECDRLEAAESRQYDAIVEAKAEVAREIFEEIEIILDPMIQLNYSIGTNHVDHIERAKAIAAEGAIRAFSDYVAELKKKYTEASDD